MSLGLLIEHERKRNLPIPVKTHAIVLDNNHNAVIIRYTYRDHSIRDLVLDSVYDGILNYKLYSEFWHIIIEQPVVIHFESAVQFIPVPEFLYLEITLNILELLLYHHLLTVRPVYLGLHQFCK